MFRVSGKTGEFGENRDDTAVKTNQYCPLFTAAAFVFTAVVKVITKSDSQHGTQNTSFGASAGPVISVLILEFD